MPEEITRKIEVEWLILADAAEIVGQKLYLLGGGWNRIYAVSDEQFDRRIAIALSMFVPFEETLQRHLFELEVIDGDGHSLAKGGGHFEVASDVGTPRHMPQRAQLVISLGLKLQSGETYQVIARVADAEEKRIQFHVMKR